jgi:ribosomal-protein-alanine N-acetyltransferase
MARISVHRRRHRQQFGKERLLAGKVVVDAANRAVARGFGNVAQAGAGIAARDEEFPGRVQDFGARGRAFGCGHCPEFPVVNERSFIHLHPSRLTTSRLLLRPLTDADVPALFAIFSHPEVMRYWSYAAADATWRRRRRWCSGLPGSYRDATRECGSSALRGASDCRGAGDVCTLFNFHASSRRAEIGYALARAASGAPAYMHEALDRARRRTPFTTLDLHRLEADIDPRNTASARTLERLGFQLGRPSGARALDRGRRDLGHVPGMDCLRGSGRRGK